MRGFALWALSEYGETMTLFSEDCAEGRSFFGYIEPLDRRDTAKPHVRTRAGGVKRAEFLLIAEPGALTEKDKGAFVVTGGRRFELLRADTLRLGAEDSHIEAVLRLTGEAAQDV